MLILWDIIKGKPCTKNGRRQIVKESMANRREEEGKRRGWDGKTARNENRGRREQGNSHRRVAIADESADNERRRHNEGSRTPPSRQQGEEEVEGSFVVQLSLWTAICTQQFLRTRYLISPLCISDIKKVRAIFFGYSELWYDGNTIMLWINQEDSSWQLRVYDNA